ncbi:MAG: molecular chaperone TorD family protein [Pyrinomonadaceae bacterium]|nr:molecular chaperone TorD family protein [Pyrinomonadaceae bacterium]MBP9109279.1 molecular chaperone TorD family protein [Pyrinomonadaceae bacterium]
MKTKRNSTRDLLAEAAEWRLISLLFDCPSNDWLRQVEDLAGPVTDKKLKRAAKAAQKQASEGLFHSIFGPGGPAPGREVSYRGWVQPGYMLAELNSFYDAFSYKPTTNEVPDHVAVETGFVAYLRLKELYALENGDNESADVTSKASITFIDDHLSKYAQKLSKLLAASGIEYLNLAGAALFARVGPDQDKSKQIFLPVLEGDNESTLECGWTAS